MSVRLYRIIQMVTNIDEAATFYASLFGVPGERVSLGRHYFDCGGTILACYDPSADGDDPGDGWRRHENEYAYFAVADLDAVVERLVRAGASSVTPIATMPWGERMCYARDPFGNGISFVDEGTVFTGHRPEA